MARQADHAGYQAKALIGLAQIESTALRDYGAAAQHVDDALRLAAPLEDSTFYLDALEKRSAIDVTRRDLVAAADAINRVLAMAEARQDRVRLLFGHFSRADVYQQMVRSCTEARQSFSLCYEALGLAKADYERAQTLSTDLGFEGLANEMAGFLRRLEQYRALVEQQESFTKSVERFALFEPGTPSDVLVTEQFATGSQSIPPGLTELISQAGITSSDPVGVYTQAMFEEAQGNADAALRDYLEAVDLLERDRRTLKDESSRGSFLEDKVAIHDPPILHLLDRRQYAEAFALLERSRARAMTDLFTTRALGLSRAGDQRLYAAAVKIRSEIALLQKKLFDLTRAADRDRHAADIRALESQINERQQQYDEALGRIRQEAPKLLDLMAVLVLSSWEQAAAPLSA